MKSSHFYKISFLLFLTCGCMLTTEMRQIHLNGKINIEDKNLTGKLIFEKFEDGAIVKKEILVKNIVSGEFEHDIIDLWEGSYMLGFNRSKKYTKYRVSIVSNCNDIIYKKDFLPLNGKMAIELGDINIHKK